MKREVRLWVALFLSLAILLGSLPMAWGASLAKKPNSSGQTIGLEAAKSISTITGVAISPLLGVGAVGAYHWWKAKPGDRGRLHWYAQPWFWVPALALVALVACKDVLGTAAPTALKKPFDVAETVENKISGLVAAGAFVPLIFSIFPEAPGDGSGGADLAALGFAAINGSSIGNAVLVPFAMLAFGLVWLAAHSINILILLSPFTTLDTALKTFRLFLLGAVTTSAFLNPFVGAVFCGIIIVIAYLIAGWTFRLTVLGTIFTWDFFTLRRHRFTPEAKKNWMFTAQPMKETPVRTYGKLCRTPDGKLLFEYRPWLVLERRELEMPAGNYAVGRGIFYPEIGRIEGERLQGMLILPPRYRGHEDEVAKANGIDAVVDVGLRKGLKAAWHWMKNLFGSPRIKERPQLLVTETMSTP